MFAELQKQDHKASSVVSADDEGPVVGRKASSTNQKVDGDSDTSKSPIKFKDAVGRKFSFPWTLVKTWKGMEELINHAFLHVDVIGEDVRQGRYDLLGPDREMILPQVWEYLVQPGWNISMHMWPMPELKKDKDKAVIDAALNDPFAALGVGDLGIYDPGKKAKKEASRKKKSMRERG